MSLAGRVAVVTGGSHGIGKAIVERLLREGASVVFCGRDARALDAAAGDLKPAGKQLLAVRGDVTKEHDVAVLVARTLEQFGRIDILVNNAGVYGPIGPAWENPTETWRDAVNINLFGAFLVCHHVVPEMIRSGRGKIINMSGGGAATPFPRFTAYAVSKAALVRFTETLALELGEHNIQVNAIAPGFVATRLHQQTLEAGDQAGADFLQRTQEQLASGAVDPAIPAALVAYLASDVADRITGKFISSVWDNWAGFGDHLDAIANSDIFTLRRIVPRDRGLEWK